MSYRTMTTRLYWSNRGEVACESHAPDPSDPRWSVEGWQLMPLRVYRALTSSYRCQHCESKSAALQRRQHSIN